MNKMNIEHMALEASAGTGKTFQLALRVTELLLKGVEPKDILCLTFTKKATTEMKDRIIENINKFADGSFNPTSGEFLNIKEKMEDYVKNSKIKCNSIEDHIKERAIIARDTIYESYSDLNIRTIDSFTSGILKMFPYEAGVRPDFEIQSDTAADIVFEKVFDDVFSDLIKKSNWKYFFTNVLTAFDENFTTFINNTKKNIKYINNNYIILKNIVNQPIDIDYLVSLVDKANTLKENIIKSKIDYAKTVTPHNDRTTNVHGNFMYNINNITDFVEHKFITSGIHKHSWFDKSQYEDNYEDQFEKIHNAAKEYVQIKVEIIEKFALNISKIVIDKLNITKNELNKFTFVDLTTLTSNMMESNLIDKDYLYFRLDSHINHILIDEFQDTSIAQWEILTPLAEEAMAGVGQYDKTGSFFYVGDPKQNIYRFRGGSSALFKSIINTYSDKIKHETLPRNYRSGKNVVESVNNLFTLIADSKINDNILNKDKDLFAPINAQLESYKLNQTHDESKGDGFVEINVGYNVYKEGCEASDFNEYSEEVYSYDCVIKAKEAKWNYNEIAILVDQNDSGDKIYEYLKENNIPAKRETSSTLNNSLEYIAIMDLAKFIETGDELSFLEFALAPSSMITYEEYKDDAYIKQIKQEIYSKITLYGKKPIFEKILLLVQELNLLERFSGKQDLLNTLDLMSIATPNEYNFITFKEILDEKALNIQSVSIKEADAVTIMTVHKSKGLQFPVIILPNIKKKIRINRKKTKLFISEPDSTDQAKLSYAASDEEYIYLKDSVQEYEKQIEDERVFLDSMNFLYVGMTRAEQALFMHIDFPGKNTPKKATNLSQFVYLLIKDRLGEYNTGKLEPSETYLANKKQIVKEVFEEEIYDLSSMPLKPRYKRDEFHRENFGGQIFGTALHDAVRFLNGKDKSSIEIAMSKVKNKFELLLDPNGLSEIKDYIEKLFSNEVWLKMFDGDIFKERSIGKTNGKTRELYAIDAYSIINENKIILCDYKTGDFEKFRNKYEKQVLNYAEILRDLYGIHDIEQYLINFHNGEVKSIRINENIII